MVANVYTNYARDTSSVNVNIGASGNNRVVFCMISGSHWEATGYWTDATISGVSGTVLATVGTTADFVRTQVLYWLDSDLPSSAGTYAVNINGTTGNTRRASVFYATNVKQTGFISVASGQSEFGNPTTSTPTGDAGLYAFLTTTWVADAPQVYTFGSGEEVIDTLVAHIGHAHTYDDDGSCSHSITGNNEYRQYIRWGIEPAGGGGGGVSIPVILNHLLRH